MKDNELPVHPEKIKPIMYVSGLTLHACQQFDMGLKLLLYHLASLGLIELDQEEAAQIVDGGKKKTTGQVMFLLKDKYEIESDLLSAMNSALETRNHFIHGFISESNDRIANPETREEVLIEIEAMRKIILTGDTAVQQILESVLLRKNIDLNELKKQVYEETKRMNEK